ncbi:MAG: hypothetical protein ACRDE7_00075 [Sphingobacterium sp.]
MRELWIRLKSKTPRPWKKLQMIAAGVCAMGATVISNGHAPELLENIAGKMVWVAGTVAAVAQFAVSMKSGNKDKVDME